MCARACARAAPHAAAARSAASANAAAAAPATAAPVARPPPPPAPRRGAASVPPAPRRRPRAPASASHTPPGWPESARPRPPRGSRPGGSCGARGARRLGPGPASRRTCARAAPHRSARRRNAFLMVAWSAPGSTPSTRCGSPSGCAHVCAARTERREEGERGACEPRKVRGCRAANAPRRRRRRTTAARTRPLQRGRCGRLCAATARAAAVLPVLGKSIIIRAAGCRARVAHCRCLPRRPQVRRGVMGAACAAQRPAWPLAVRGQERSRRSLWRARFLGCAASALRCVDAQPRRGGRVWCMHRVSCRVPRGCVSGVPA
jgi:hypothetical protein